MGRSQLITDSTHTIFGREASIHIWSLKYPTALRYVNHATIGLSIERKSWKNYFKGLDFARHRHTAAAEIKSMSRSVLSPWYQPDELSTCFSTYYRRDCDHILRLGSIHHIQELEGTSKSVALHFPYSCWSLESRFLPHHVQIIWIRCSPYCQPNFSLFWWTNWLVVPRICGNLYQPDWVKKASPNPLPQRCF